MIAAPRPGFGRRHPLLARAIATSEPIASLETTWANGTLPLRLTGFTSDPELPDEIVLSVRAIVRVDDRFVMCTSVDGSHAWPGGRREPGETHAQTATREVYEETGWHVEPDSLIRLGWLHWEHRGPMPEGHTWPYPDFLQVVYAARASERESEEWADTDGYEADSALVTYEEAERAFPDNPVCLAMMRLTIIP